VTTEHPAGAVQAIARARSLLSSEDEHLSARLDDVEGAADVARVDGVLALVAAALAGPRHPRPSEYRKLAALQAAARARRTELAERDAGVLRAASTATSPPPAPAVPAVGDGRGGRSGRWRAWLGRLTRTGR
jgi:hypothetical protein